MFFIVNLFVHKFLLKISSQLVDMVQHADSQVMNTCRKHETEYCFGLFLSWVFLVSYKDYMVLIFHSKEI